MKQRKTRSTKQQPKQGFTKHGGRCATIVRESYNDISFWNKHPKLMDDACSLSFGNPVGLPVTIDPECPDIVIPGIMKIKLHQSFGVSDSDSSDVNVMAKALYAFIRHKNSGSRNYEYADYYTYVLAMTSLYTVYAEMVRLYGVMQTYSRLNRYIAKPLVQAMGFNYDDILTHLADLRYFINNFAIKLNSFCVPKDLSVYDNAIANSSSIFKDSMEDKASLYVLQYTDLFKWSAIAYETGSSLLAITAPYTSAGGCSYAQLVNFATSLINDLLTNEDIGIMSGDTLKAYGAENCYTVLGIPSDYAVTPEFNEGALAKIHNLDITGKPSTYIATNSDGLVAEAGPADSIRQINGYLYYQPGVLTGSAESKTSTLNTVMDCGMDNPSPAFIMESSRFKSLLSLKRDVENAEYISLDSCGTEFVTGITVFYLQSNGALDQIVYDQAIEWIDMEISSTASLLTGIILLTFKDKFDWSPILKLKWTADTTSEDNVLLAGEVFNYTVVDRSFLKKVHNAALLSALNVNTIKSV